MAENLTTEENLTRSAGGGEEEEGEVEEAVIVLWVVNSLFLVVSLYVLAAVIAHHRRSRARMTWNKRSREVQIGLALAMIVFTLARLLMTYLIIASRSLLRDVEDRDHACTLMVSISSAWLEITVLPSFLLLWYRQRSLYRQPLLKHLDSLPIRLISRLSIVLISLKTLAHPVWFALSRRVVYDPDRHGCLVSERHHALAWVSTLTNSLVFATVACLCALFVVPLYEQIRMQRRSGTAGGGGEGETTNRRLLRFTVVNTACLAASALATVACLVANKLLFAAAPPHHRYVVNNAMLVVYLASLLFLFDRCNNRLAELYNSSLRSVTAKRRRKRPSAAADTTATALQDSSM